MVDAAELTAVMEQVALGRRGEGKIAQALGWDPPRVRAALGDLAAGNQVLLSSGPETGGELVAVRFHPLWPGTASP